MQPIVCSSPVPAAQEHAQGADHAGRLLEVDALRGLAALSVLLFHYTTRLTELFPAAGSPSFAVPTGYFGVNLFFIISGFVIFMTLERTTRGRDFWLSRLGRLFPAYWVAIAATFTICHLLGLPGKLVNWQTALANLVMVHGLFGVAHVDGVYWTLEVEMLFYCGMFLLYRLRWMAHIHWFLCALMVLRLAHFAMVQRWDMGLPWIVYRLLILQYLPWFALGIAVFRTSQDTPPRIHHGMAMTVGLALVTLWICESAAVAGLAVVFAMAVYGAARSQLALLRMGPLVWLGGISYSLYLLHENIGWAIQLRLMEWQLSPDLALLVALASVLVLADLCRRYVELPAVRWARTMRKKV